jgi:ATP-binding cassette subfamily B protein
MRRINEIFHYPLEIEDSPKTDRSIETIRGDLEIENVTVIYPGTERPALDSVCLYVPAGRTVALIGAVGAGKSTLLSLIPRLFDPTSGRVLIDGVDARTIPLKTLRAAIGVVPQEPFILGGSLRDNLLLGSAGRPEWELEEIAAACRLNDLSELPAGFDTVVGERGITLSGGQRQRASLARALIQDPRILILDDSLSSVDARTENEILERLQQFMRNRTTLIVSSRIATTRIASQVVVLQQGKVVEAGTHEELLAQGGYYRDLYAKQLLEQELIQDG